MKWNRRIPCLARLPLTFVALFCIYLTFVGFHLKRSNGISSSAKTKKYDHIVLGPAAGQGIPGRLQCNDLSAVTRRHLPSISSANENVTFVTVFTIYNQSGQNPSGVETYPNVQVGNTSYDKTQRAMAILDVFANFIKVSMPMSRIIVLTDPSSNFPFVPNNSVVKQISGNYSRSNLMLQRIMCYIEFLDEKLARYSETQMKVEHFIFTDSDVAVVGDLSHMVTENPKFHIGLTFRNNKEQPLNSGFIIVRGTREAMLKAKLFLRRVLDVYISNFKKASRMLGDQMALAFVIKSQPSFDAEQFKYHRLFSAKILGTNVLFLPCAIYNWTPPEGAGQFHGMPEDVKVIHFKGSRKRLMLEAWNFYNSHPLEFSDMMCLILKSGRTKYDF